MVPILVVRNLKNAAWGEESMIKDPVEWSGTVVFWRTENHNFNYHVF